MKTLVTAFWMTVLVVLATGRGIGQQVKELKLPAEATVTGVIKTITRGGFLDLAVADENGTAHDMRISLPQEIKITMDGSAATAGDLRIGKAVTVAYAPQSPVPDPTMTRPEEQIVGMAQSISIIFGTNSPLGDIKLAQPQPSAGIPANFIGSWVSTGTVKTEKMQITTNSIRWFRNVLDPRDICDSNSNKPNVNGDISFDVKVLLTTDVFASTTVTLKARDGKLFMKANPASADLGVATITSPGEERMYFRERIPDSLGNKIPRTLN